MNNELKPLPRFYCCPLDKSVAELSASESRHLSSVYRLGTGDKVELFDGSGGLASAIVISAAKKTVGLKIENLQTAHKPFPQKITLAVSIAKGSRFDWLIEKSTELGIDRICPVLFERTVKQPANPKIADRWRNLTIAAAKQSRTLFLPQIDSPSPLPKAVELLKKDFPKGRFLVGSLSPDCPSLMALDTASDDIIAFVGPEGGLTEQEQALLRKAASQEVRLTDTVLRIETAALAFAAILASLRCAKISP